MNVTKKYDLTSEFSANSFDIESEFFSCSLNTRVPQEIENCSWRQVSMKLSRMFPDLNPELIKRIYILKSSDKSLQNEDLLQAVVDEILENEKYNSLFEISLGSVKRKVDVDEQIQTLKEIFPDASPFYLKCMAIKEANNPYAIDKFVQEKLSTRDIPTENYFSAKNQNAFQTQINPDSFDVEDYLKKIPNPIEAFENPKRKCNYNLKMFDLLKNHFRKLKISTISDAYTKNAFNAVLTFESLKNMKLEIKKNRKKSSITPENSQVEEEFVYIINKQTIKNFITEMKEREKAMIQKMKDNHELLECECCFEEIPPSSTFAITCREGHVFCGLCTIKGTDEEIAKGAHRIKCFADCTSEIHLNSLQKILLPNKFKILLAKVQEHEITSAKIEGLVSCPFCYYASIPPENETVFQCMNFDCGLQSCRLCKKLNHLPKECAALEKNKKARLILEEKMTSALVRKCKSCGREIIKEGGCNVVTCICGANFCYFCGLSTISHAHLTGKCNGPVNSTTDASAVVFVARKIESELLKLDPNLKIDVDSILPEVSGGAQSSQYLPTHALIESSTLPEL